MAISNFELRLKAVERYHNSIRQAQLQEHWARIRGKHYNLLKFEEVANRLHIRQQIPTGLQMVKLDQIVGSVGRYHEFTKTFLPRMTIKMDRWVAVDMIMNSLSGFPPVELYKIGEVYFVIDGNHRISVARANGNKDIEAAVIECQMDVHFTVEDFLDTRWLSKMAKHEFFAQTHLDQLCPGARLEVTDPEHYATLLQHIAVHRYLANQPTDTTWGARDGRALRWEEAVVSWYDTVYMPIIEAIRNHQVQAQFPRHTETDLYLWITQYREGIAGEYGVAPLGPETAVRAFAASHSERRLHRLMLALQHTLQGKLRQSMKRVKMPPGITEDEFHALRLRHDAGELSLTEANYRHAQAAFFVEPACNRHLSMQSSA